MGKRRTHSPEFKARIAMEAISGRKRSRRSTSIEQYTQPK
jgi:transposase-like protein